MKNFRVTKAIFIALLGGCSHMNSIAPIIKVEPSAAQLEELVLLTKRIISQPPRSCEETHPEMSGDSTCGVSVEVVLGIKVEPLSGGSRLDVLVSIKPEYCVSPADLIVSLPKEWAYEFTHGSAGPSDSTEIFIGEVYDSTILNQRIVMDLDPHVNSICLRTFRVIHWDPIFGVAKLS